MKPDYCVQNEGDCLTCGLSNYGRDCVNNRIITMGPAAKAITGGNESAMRKILNDTGATPPFDELKADPWELVPRPLLIDLAAIRAGDRVGSKAVELLRG